MTVLKNFMVCSHDMFGLRETIKFANACFNANFGKFDSNLNIHLFAELNFNFFLGGAKNKVFSLTTNIHKKIEGRKADSDWRGRVPFACREAFSIFHVQRKEAEDLAR